MNKLKIKKYLEAIENLHLQSSNRHLHRRPHQNFVAAGCILLATFSIGTLTMLYVNVAVLSAVIQGASLVSGGVIFLCSVPAFIVVLVALYETVLMIYVDNLYPESALDLDALEKFGLKLPGAITHMEKIDNGTLLTCQVEPPREQRREFQYVVRRAMAHLPGDSVEVLYYNHLAILVK